MKLVEHLDYVLGLVEKKAPYAEIKGSLLAMHEEVHGVEQAAADKVRLAEENAALKAEIARAKSPELEAISKDILRFFFDQGDSVAGHALQQRFKLKVAIIDHHIDALLKRKFITQTCLGGDSASCWFAITGNGRDFIMKTLA